MLIQHIMYSFLQVWTETHCASYSESRGVMPQPTPSQNWCSMCERRCTTESNAGRIIWERILIPLPLVCAEASLQSLLFGGVAGSTLLHHLHGTLQESSGDVELSLAELSQMVAGIDEHSDCLSCEYSRVVPSSVGLCVSIGPISLMAEDSESSCSAA